MPLHADTQAFPPPATERHGTLIRALDPAPRGFCWLCGTYRRSPTPGTELTVLLGPHFGVAGTQAQAFPSHRPGRLPGPRQIKPLRRPFGSGDQLTAWKIADSPLQITGHPHFCCTSVHLSRPRRRDLLERTC